jgi:YD repeat-containing protein
MKKYEFAVVRVRIALARSVAVIVLIASVNFACAAVTDCKGLAVDGQAECILPTYAPTRYAVCDIAGSYLYRSNAWTACYTEMGVTQPILSEAVTVALASCFDKKLVPATGGVSGSVPWLPDGTNYNDNLCTLGTVRDVNGHHIWGVGNLYGASSAFAFTRQEPVSCPTGYTEVIKSIRGSSALVACKPISTCAPDQVWSTARNACLTVVWLPSTPKEPPPPPLAPGPKPPTCPSARNMSVGDPIYPLTGAMGESVATGFKLNGVELILNYNTARKLNGKTVGDLPSFGSLWSSNLHRTLAVGSGASTITGYRGNGTVVAFTLKGGVYVPDVDVNDKVVAINGNYQYTDAQTQQLETYNSKGQLILIENPDGTFLSFSYSVAATSTAPTDGYLVQVTDNAGRSLKFEYKLPSGSLDLTAAVSGLISKITNSMGQNITPTYDANLNLVALTWPDNKVRQFLYENGSFPWAMTGLLDENANRYQTWSYDEKGRAVSTSSALGADAYSVTYATPPQYILVETLDPTLNILYRRYAFQAPEGLSITTPNGQVIAWNSSNVLGAPVMTSSSQPAGSGCAASSNQSVFDASGNLLTRDDFKGFRTCYAYDSSNREVTRVEGLASTVNCSIVLPVDAVLPQGARKITTQWHADWRLRTKVTSPGRIVTTVYNGQTDPSTAIAANCTPAAVLLSGKPLPLVCKVAIQSTVDAATQTTTYTYDDAGNVLTVKDARNNQSTIQYMLSESLAVDLAFERVQILLHGDGIDGSNVFIDNSTPAKTVTIAHGTPINSAANKKFGDTSLYFPGNSSIKVSGAGGTTFWGKDWTVEFSVLPASPNQAPASIFGNRDNSINPMGGGELHLHYSSGLLTNIVLQIAVPGAFDGFGVDTSTPGFTAARASAGSFNQIAVVKQGLNYTFFLNGIRLANMTRTATPLPGGELLYVGAANHDAFYPYYFNGYVDDFRITMGTPRYMKNYALRTTAFPDVGLAPGTTDLALYNVQSVSNAAGHVVQFTQYDRLGRVLQSIDPRGVVTDTSYTPRGWIASITTTAPGGIGRTTNYSYDGVGQLTQVNQPDGTSLTYSYDAAHRLISVTDTRGNVVSYTLDNVGNRIAEQVRDPAGTLQRSINRSYDALNRLQQVTGAAQ